jgi:hypothetical protein
MTDPTKQSSPRPPNSEARRLSPEEVGAAVDDLRKELNQIADSGGMERIDCNQESIEQGLAKLVLGLIELLRRLLERQAVRRMDGGSLTDQQVEDMGLALMKLEKKIGELAGSFGLTIDDLNLELGPLGKLLDK